MLTTLSISEVASWRMMLQKECEKAVLSKSTIFHLPKLSDDCCTAIAFASVCYDIETGPAWLYILEKCRENFHN